MTGTNLESIGSGIELPAARIESCGDISCEFLIDPIPRPKPAPFKVNLKPAVAEVIFIDNGKPNSIQILEMARDILRSRGVKVREEIRKKAGAGTPIHLELLGQLKQERGLLLLGVND